MTGNARSLNNKLDELCANIRFLNEYRESALICFSETWFHPDVTDAAASMDNFSLYRCDRTKDSNKACGGGVCAYVNKSWCNNNNTEVILQSCTPDLEILSLKLRPYYMPREFTNIFLNVVYIPPQADTIIASEKIADYVNEQQTKSPDSVVLITGDFNQCTLESSLPTFGQFVNVPTRNEKTIDLCYCNIKESYRSVRMPALGNSDHTMTHMLPNYKTVFKSNKPVKKTVTILGDDNIDCLRDCFDSTDWNVFIDACDNIDELTDTVSSYVNFCELACSTTKTVTCYSNEKPWINREVRDTIKERQTAFQYGDSGDFKAIDKKLKKQIKKAKFDYKKTLEDNFNKNNSKKTWDSMKQIVGMNKKSDCLNLSEDATEYSNKLNQFYNRFDTHNFKEKSKEVLANIMHTTEDHEDIFIKEFEVKTVFQKINPRKASGPDNVKGKVLKSCLNELSFIFTYIFNLSLKVHRVPIGWKTAEIIPVPKKPKVSTLNDLRPVALTPIAMKCFEKIIFKHISSCLSPLQDPCQFAYRAKRSVDDAILIFFNNIYKHIDIPKQYCRVLFVDFSSAFNTIQPHVLLPKLHDLKVNRNIIAWILDFFK